jgi:hypothetical protein
MNVIYFHYSYGNNQQAPGLFYGVREGLLSNNQQTGAARPSNTLVVSSGYPVIRFTFKNPPSRALERPSTVRYNFINQLIGRLLKQFFVQIETPN